MSPADFNYSHRRNDNLAGQAWLLRHAIFWLGLGALCLTQLSAAWPGEPEGINPAARSSMTKAEACQLARLWTLGRPGRSYCDVSTTGSMTPTFDSHSVLLLEPVLPSQAHVHDIVRYRSSRSADGNITHRIISIDAAAGTFVPEGDNNVGADGSVPLSYLAFRVAGILYTQ